MGLLRRTPETEYAIREALKRRIEYTEHERNQALARLADADEALELAEDALIMYAGAIDAGMKHNPGPRSMGRYHASSSAGAHRALAQIGAVRADRPPTTSKEN